MDDSDYRIDDVAAEAICRAIKEGYGRGAFPLGPDGAQMGWYDWLRSVVYPNHSVD